MRRFSLCKTRSEKCELSNTNSYTRGDFQKLPTEREHDAEWRLCTQSFCGQSSQTGKNSVQQLQTQLVTQLEAPREEKLIHPRGCGFVPMSKA